MTPLLNNLRLLHDSGVALFGQNSRLLTLRFPESSGFGSETLLPHRLVGEEGLSTSYRYVLDCLSPDTHLELKRLLGQPVEVGLLLLPDGGSRLLTGLVTHASQAGADGGFAKYVLTLEPALATLRHRRNSRVFQDQSVPQIVACVLDEHLSANPAFPGVFQYRNRLTKDYPPRSYCLPYRETDLAFIERLLAEEGISYRYRHGPDPERSVSPRSGSEEHRGRTARDEAPPSTDALPQHTLILFDRNDEPDQDWEVPINARPLPGARWHMPTATRLGQATEFDQDNDPDYDYLKPASDDQMLDDDPHDIFRDRLSPPAGDDATGTAATNLILAIAYAYHQNVPLIVAGARETATGENESRRALGDRRPRAPPTRPPPFDPNKPWFRARGGGNAYLPWWSRRYDANPNSCHGWSD